MSSKDAIDLLNTSTNTGLLNIVTVIYKPQISRPKIIFRPKVFGNNTISDVEMAIYRPRHKKI